jgi:hypothetical protein
MKHSAITNKFQIQRVTLGTPSQINQSECTIETGLDGVIAFEVGTNVAIDETHTYMDVVIPTTYFLAKNQHLNYK